MFIDKKPPNYMRYSKYPTATSQMAFLNLGTNPQEVFSHGVSEGGGMPVIMQN